LLPPGCDAEDALGGVGGDARKDGDDRA